MTCNWIHSPKKKKIKEKEKKKKKKERMLGLDSNEGRREGKMCE